MKIRYYLILLFVFAAFIEGYSQSCPYGTPDPSYWPGADDFYYGFTADYDTTDTDTVYFTQGVDTTIIMQYLLPKKQVVTQPVSGTATVTSVQVLGVAGLPIGIGFTLDSVATLNSNTYFPQDYRYGAVTLCGKTFATPGLKILDVTVRGCGSLAGISACQNQTFPLFIRVLPGSSSGVISMSPPQACEEATVNFEKQIPDPNPNLFTTEYIWDFSTGDSTTGTSTSYFFDSPGIYPITLTQVIYEYYISELSVTCIAGWYGDIEELTAAQDPEPYVLVNAGGAAVQLGPNGTSGISQSFSGLQISISDTNISFNVWDEDNGPPFGSQDDNLGTTIETVFPTTTNPSTSYGFSNSNFSGTYKINKRILQVTEFTDTVFIYDLSTTTVQAPSGLQFCEGDSVVLDAGSGFDYYQWYRDTTQLFGADSQTIKVATPGNYFVEVLEPGNICPGYSDTVGVILVPVTVPEIEITSDGQFLYVDNPDTFQVQWYIDSVAVPGEIADSFETLGSAGPFSVSFTNDIGCVAFSANYDQCIAGQADPVQMDTLSCNCGDGSNQTYNVTSSGFALKTGSDLAWAVTPKGDGLLESDAQVQTAANQDLVFISNGDGSFDLDPCNLGNLAEGAYYLTPFAVEAIEQDTVLWTEDVDSNYCPASFEICIGLSGTGWKIDPLTIELPNGDVIDVIDALAGGIVPPGTPITPTLWSLATAQLGDPACLDLIDIIGYYGNPNGVWKINLPNNGTGALDFNIDDFDIVIDADTCPLISQDQVIPMDGISGTVAAGETRTLSIQVPPLPAGFPTIQPTCQAFGTPIEFYYKGNCTSIIATEDDDLNAFNVYPNPNNGNFTVEFELMQPQQIVISLYSATGQMIAREAWNGLSGKYRKNYDFNDLPTGVYLLQLNIENQQLTKKVIIR